MNNKSWEVFYRGVIGKWADVFKPGDDSKIESNMFKNYLSLKTNLTKLVKELNEIEDNIVKNYPLLKSIPTSINQSENEIYAKEIIVYINSKNT